MKDLFPDEKLKKSTLSAPLGRDRTPLKVVKKHIFRLNMANFKRLLLTSFLVQLSAFKTISNYIFLLLEPF